MKTPDNSVVYPVIQFFFQSFLFDVLILNFLVGKSKLSVT